MCVTIKCYNGWYFYTWNCLLCSIIPMSMKVEWEWDTAHPGVAPVGVVEGERLRLVCGPSVRTVDSCTGREGLRYTLSPFQTVPCTACAQAKSYSV